MWKLVEWSMNFRSYLSLNIVASPDTAIISRSLITNPQRDEFESRFWDEIMTFLHRLHIAETYPQQAERLAPEVLSTWLRYAPHAQPVERDWEDWAENAVMLHALDKASGGKVEIIPAGDR